MHFKSDVCFIVRNGLASVEIARMLNVDRTRVLRWGRGERAMMDAQEARLLEKLRKVVKLLRGTLTPKGVRQWVHAQHRALDMRCPVDCFSIIPERVREAAEAFDAGVFI